jgi:hypothetical protein
MRRRTLVYSRKEESDKIFKHTYTRAYNASHGSLQLKSLDGTTPLRQSAYSTNIKEPVWRKTFHTHWQCPLSSVIRIMYSGPDEIIHQYECIWLLVCSLFNDTFMWLRLHNVEWMDGECQVNWKGCASGHGLISGIYLEGLRKPLNTSVMIGGFRPENWTWDLPNMKQ